VISYDGGVRALRCSVRFDAGSGVFWVCSGLVQERRRSTAVSGPCWIARGYTAIAGHVMSLLDVGRVRVPALTSVSAAGGGKGDAA
jgi:hypothetical protein